MSETVSYDSQGNYQVGKPLQEMDVQAGLGTAQPKMNHVSMHLPPPMPGAQAPAVEPRPKFNLASLRQKASAPEAPAPTPAPEPEEKPETPVETPKPEEPVEEGTTQDISKLLQDSPAPVHVPGAEPPIPAPEPVVEEPMAEAAPEPEEEQATEQEPVKTSTPFKLQQLGLAGRMLAENVDSAAEMDAAVKVGQIPLQQMDLQGERVSGTYENKVTVEESAEPVESDAGASTEQEAMTFTEETPFEIISLRELMQMLYATESVLAEWMGRVAREYSKRPTSVFSSAAYPNLRAYSITYPLGSKAKAGVIYVTIGVGKKITTCAFDTKRAKLSDASQEISVSGTCAIVQEMPVASCSQRTRTAIRL